MFFRTKNIVQYTYFNFFDIYIKSKKMLTVDELQKCKTYIDGLRLIGLNYITQASKEKLFNECKMLNFDFESHIQKQKQKK